MLGLKLNMLVKGGPGPISASYELQWNMNKISHSATEQDTEIFFATFVYLSKV